jgi:Omp85 superfamily domain
MKRLLLTIALFSFLLAGAQDSTTTQKKFQVMPMPVLLFDPFTGFGYGVLANFSYLLGDAATTRYSNSQFLALHTTRGQTAVQAGHQIFLKDETFLWQGKLQYLDWPEYTYALGARTANKEPVKELISYKAIELEERVMWRIGTSKNFIGPQYRLFSSWNLSSDQADSVSFFKQQAIGNQSFIASGIGVHFVHDSRDNVQNAYSGKYLELAVNPYVKLLGSTQNWSNLRVDYRWYKTLKVNGQKVVATRLLCEQALGEVPYMLTPMPGRYFATRGYVQGRYRGKTFLSAEAEYRRHIWRGIGGVVFGNINTVSEPKGNIQYLNPAAGAGIRLALSKAQRINLRVDYAKGLNDNGGIYFHVTEAF